MMLHSEFCAVWLSLSDVTGKKELCSLIFISNGYPPPELILLQLFQYRLCQKGLKQFVLYLEEFKNTNF